MKFVCEECGKEFNKFPPNDSEVDSVVVVCPRCRAVARVKVRRNGTFKKQERFFRKSNVKETMVL